MALRELVDGDCGGPSPFTTLTSHLMQDRGFREEGIGQIDKEHNVHHHAPSSFENATADQLVDEYIESCANVHPQTFRMKDILQEIHEIDNNIEHQPARIIHQPLDQDAEWANQFMENRTDFYEHNTERIWAESQQHQHLSSPSIAQDANELGLGQTWAEDYIEHTLESEKEDTDKPLEEYKNIENDSPNIAFSKFMKFMHQEGEMPIESLQNSPGVTLNTSEKWAQNFSEKQNVDEKEQQQSSSDTKTKSDDVIEDNKNDENLSTEASGWANEFLGSSSSNVDSYESAFWARLQGEWDKLSNNQLNDTYPWMSDYESYYDPFKDYKFNENNPMKHMPDALEEGKRRLDAGDLPSAVLCFEAAVQQNEENPEAWLLLGKTQAENEQDPLAIAALKKCLSLETSNSSALMTLAVSYTNESFQHQACLTLKQWLLTNEKYNHLLMTKSNNEIADTNKYISTILFRDVYNEVKELFIQAARMNPTNEIDADVQSGLGVLFNLSSEFDKAADCFQAALQIRPNDYRLWNRLGASLANGQRSEEAINAYSRALELSPGFIRARYNLGISCISLGAYKEAGEHLLTALNQQAAGRDVQGHAAPPRTMSETIWSTFRLVLSLMHKYDLNEAVDKRDLAKLNAEFGIA